MPLGRFSKETLREIILATIAVAGQQDGVFVRYWFSVGRGDFSVSPANCLSPSFFVVVHGAMTGSVPAGTMPGKSEMKLRGVKEYFVSVPTKPKLLANIKSNNYMINALCCMESSEKGGYLGIQLDASGNVAEGAVGNVAIITKDNLFRTPHFDNILAGTTVKRCLAVGELLIKQGLLKGMEFATLRAEDVKNAEEAMSLGGGHIVPIIAVDDQPIGSGQVGPVFKAMDELLVKDMHQTHRDKIPFSNYSNTYSSVMSGLGKKAVNFVAPVVLVGCCVALAAKFSGTRPLRHLAERLQI